VTQSTNIRMLFNRPEVNVCFIDKASGSDSLLDILELVSDQQARVS